MTADRIVGTSIVIGLSLALVRWISPPHTSSVARDTKQYTTSRQRRSWMPWWWLAFALRRWSDKSRHGNEHLEDSAQDENNENSDGDCEHQGSCQCSSIKFAFRGPQRLQAVDSPGTNRYPHIPTPASKFQLIKGEEFLCVNMQNGEGETLEAYVSCKNCGVHVFHADQSSGELEVNAHCVDGFEKQTTKSTIETVFETEPFLESSDSLNGLLLMKECLSSDPTQPESSSTSMLAESDDLSMESSSIHSASMSGVASAAVSNDIRMDRSGLPPLPPSKVSSIPRMLSSDRSVKTMPPRFEERRGVGSSWSIGSMELSTDLDNNDVRNATISPKMRDQMKKYMQKYT